MTEHGTSPTSHGTSGETQEPRYREIAAAVERHGGKRSAAARELGISPSTVTVAVLRAERDRFREALRKADETMACHWSYNEQSRTNMAHTCVVQASEIIRAALYGSDR